MDVALYARVSTAHQQQAQTIDQQLERLRAVVAAHPAWNLADEHVYCDDGYSGAQLNRPGLDRLRDQATLAAFEVVVITAPDRLARKYVHQVLLLEELQQCGCRVEFVDRPMSDDPHDQLLLQIRGAVAEYERSLIAERMRRGRQAKLRSGLLLPWTHIPYGYLVDPAHPRDATQVHRDPVQALVVEQIFAWYTDPVAPLSLYGLATKLHTLGISSPTGKPRWSESSIRGLLRSSTYRGVAYSGHLRLKPARGRCSRLRPLGAGFSYERTPPEDWIAIPIPAIVSEEVWMRAQERLAHNKRFARRNNQAHEYLLRGLVYCGHCRYGCSGRNADPAYRYYLCRGRTLRPETTGQPTCQARYIPAAALDAVVWQDLCQIITDPTHITQALARAKSGAWLPQALQSRRTTLMHTSAQVERQKTRLLDVFLADVISRDEFERKHAALVQTAQRLAQQVRQVDAQAQQHTDVAALSAGVTDFCQRIQATLAHLTFAQRRQLVELLIDCVVVTDGRVEIRYVIPTAPAGEHLPFCQLRTGYFDQVLPGLTLLDVADRDLQVLQ